jgi:hypothetical protein
MLGLIFISRADLGSRCICVSNAYLQRPTYFAVVTSATITWNSIHKLLLLLDFSNWSSFYECPTECTFCFENGPNIEAVPNVFEFFVNIPKIWDTDYAISLSHVAVTIDVGVDWRIDLLVIHKS